MKNIVDLLVEYLRTYGVEEDRIRIGTNYIEVLLKTQVINVKTGKVITGDMPVYFVPMGDWLKIVAPIMSLDSIPEGMDREKFYLDILKANTSSPELNFGVDKQNNTLVLYAWIHLSALTYENFASELAGMMGGIVKFLGGILPNYPELEKALSSS